MKSLLIILVAVGGIGVGAWLLLQNLHLTLISKDGTELGEISAIRILQAYLKRKKPTEPPTISVKPTFHPAGDKIMTYDLDAILRVLMPKK